MFALPIFPGSRPPSIVGAHELNFCVRDGNRWTLMTINTNSYGWLFTIFYIKSVAASNSYWIISSTQVPVKLFIPRRSPAQRVRAEATSNDTGGISRWRNMEHCVMRQGAGDPWENRTPVTGVRGRCLNRLTNGPWCTFRDSNPGPTD